MEDSKKKMRHRLRTERRREIDIEKTQHARRLRVQLRALDQLLGSLPLEQHSQLNLNAILAKDADMKKPGALREVVATTPRAELIPATLVDIYQTSLQNRAYQNVYRHSDIKRSRDPTYSEVLELLPQLDKILKLSLRDKFEAVLDKVTPFRFLSLPAELRLEVYSHLLPCLPYLVIEDVRRPGNKYRQPPLYSLVPFQVCRQIHSELTKYFYNNQTLVWNMYGMTWGINWVEERCSRDYFLVRSMRPETRSYFKKLEIRLHSHEEPNSRIQGPHWKTHPIASWDTMFDWTLEAFPNLKVILVCFELEYNCLEHASGFVKYLKGVVDFLIARIPRKYDLQWDFRATSDPEYLRRLEEVPLETRGTMGNIKDLVTERMVERGSDMVECESVERGPAYKIKRKIFRECTAPPETWKYKRHGLRMLVARGPAYNVKGYGLPRPPKGK